MSERISDEVLERWARNEAHGLILVEARRARASEAALRAEIKSMYATDREKEGAALEAYRKLLTERDALLADNNSLSQRFMRQALERDALLAENKRLLERIKELERAR